MRTVKKHKFIGRLLRLVLVTLPVLLCPVPVFAGQLSLHDESFVRSHANLPLQKSFLDDYEEYRRKKEDYLQKHREEWGTKLVSVISTGKKHRCIESLIDNCDILGRDADKKIAMLGEWMSKEYPPEPEPSIRDIIRTASPAGSIDAGGRIVIAPSGRRSGAGQGTPLQKSSSIESGKPCKVQTIIISTSGEFDHGALIERIYHSVRNGYAHADNDLIHTFAPSRVFISITDISGALSRTTSSLISIESTSARYVEIIGPAESIPSFRFFPGEILPLQTQIQNMTEIPEC